MIDKFPTRPMAQAEKHLASRPQAHLICHDIVKCFNVSNPIRATATAQVRLKSPQDAR